jgi:hypothetical protein
MKPNGRGIRLQMLPEARSRNSAMKNPTFCCKFNRFLSYYFRRMGEKFCITTCARVLCALVQ